MRTFGAAAVLAAVLLGCAEDGGRRSAVDHEAPQVRGYAAVLLDRGVGELRAGSPTDTVSQGGDTFVVLGNPIFTESNIAGVDVSPEGRVADFHLDEQGTRALESFTSQEGVIGTRLALWFGSRFVNFPVVQSANRSGRFVLVGLTEDEIGQAMSSFGARGK